MDVFQYAHTLTLHIGDRPVLQDVDVTLHMERDGIEWCWHLAAVEVLDADGNAIMIRKSKTGGMIDADCGDRFAIVSHLASAIWCQAVCDLDGLQTDVDGEWGAIMIMNGHAVESAEAH